MSYIGKEYKLVKQENFDDFLKAVGLPEDKIQATLASKDTQVLLKDGDNYTYVNTTPQGKQESTFKLGVEFDEVIGDGTVKSTYTIDGNTVIQKINGQKGLVTFKKEYNGDELVVTVTSNKWDGVAKKYYKA